MNKTTEPVALAGIEPIDYVYRGSDGLIYRTIPQDVPVIETIPRYSAATVEQLVHERDKYKDSVEHYGDLYAKLAAITKKADGFFDALQLAAKINAEGQAREQQLREALEAMVLSARGMNCGLKIADDALALPQDDTALREWGAKLLEESANESEAEGWMSITLSALRRKATKLREGKK